MLPFNFVLLLRMYLLAKIIAETIITEPKTIAAILIFSVSSFISWRWIFMKQQIRNSLVAAYKILQF
jgi:hypothetical protein